VLVQSSIHARAAARLASALIHIAIQTHAAPLQKKLESEHVFRAIAAAGLAGDISLDLAHALW
jgi:HEAT repeat protein